MKKTTTLMLGLLALTFGGALSVQPAAAKTKVKEPTEKKAFTAQERATIKGYRQQVKGISNSTKGMYVQKPSLKKSFNPGKLSQKYINATVKSVNFYRQMYGLNAIEANPQWNEDAQYGAATLAAANKGLAHELAGIKRPSYVSKTAWNRGVDATGYSNLGEGVVKPYDNVLNYLVDSGAADYIPGHREWLLGNTIEIGVGQAGSYNDLKVFEGGAKCRAFDPQAGLAKEVAYPKAGVFPINAVEDGTWSLSYSVGTGEEATKPNVKVTDNTTHKQVKVTHVTNYNSETGYGWFKTSISYQPAPSKVKVNHAYTVKISGLGNHADVHYQTKLFNLRK
ncbi:CAP domain-containing protein [Levilactobacillus enshiensis]|uniref:CAP domain-containing protein n=1 Tax=Levilactobacillus enshiensis TaxID=2590213 RepID=UPI00117A9939|nr:CAP domain-containing protein [Levilactobacillus enshiensis]